MRHMDSSIRNLHREVNVAFDDVSFGSGWHPAQPQTKRMCARMHGTLLGEACIFCVLHDGKTQLRSLNQGCAHDVILEDGLAVIGDRDSSGLLKSAKIS